MNKKILTIVVMGMLYGCSSAPKAPAYYGKFESLNPEFQYTGNLKVKTTSQKTQTESQK
jgi:hypothetical protein